MSEKISTLTRPSTAESTRQPAISYPSEAEFEQMKVARQARELQQREAYKSREATRKRESWKSRMKKAFAATALFATVQSGGLVDIAGDHFSDAGTVAAGAIEVSETEIPEELDGIAFEKYSQETRAKVIAEYTADVENRNDARSTVIDLFSRIDDEGYATVVTEVEADKSAHPELYASSQQINRAKEAINDADSNAQAVNALSDFMQNYEILVDFYDGKVFTGREAEVKQVLTAYVNIFSVLPKDFIQEAQLNKVTVSDEPVLSSEQTAGAEGGAYFSNGSINIVAQSKFIDVSTKLETLVGGTDYSYESTLAHDLGHALIYNLGVYTSLAEAETVDMNDSIDAKAYFGQIAANAASVPGYMSTYARSTPGENTAEVLSGILSDRSDGLARTNEWRRFGSGANKSMIDMLAQLESNQPGIAKILIANRVS